MATTKKVKLQAEPVAVVEKAKSREDQLAELQTQLKEAVKIKDPVERQSTLSIIGARMEDLVQMDHEDTSTFADKVRSLDESLASIDLEVTSYEKFTNVEQAMLDNASNDVRKAEHELEEAGKSFFLWRGAKVDSAKAELERAKAAIPIAQQKADNMRAVRLANADIADSLNRYISTAQAVRDQAEVRKTSAENQTVILQEQQNITENELQTETTKAEELRAEVEKLEAQKVDAEADLAELEKGTTVYIEAENALRALENELDIALAKRDKALGLIDTLNKFLSQATGSLRTQRKLKRNLEIVIQILVTGLDKRVPLIEARLDTMKSMETLKVARDVVGVGDDLDESNAKYAAIAANAADEFVTSYLEKEPERIRKQRDILAEQEENALAMKERIKELWKEYDKNYIEEAA